MPAETTPPLDTAEKETARPSCRLVTPSWSSPLSTAGAAAAAIACGCDAWPAVRMQTITIQSNMKPADAKLYNGCCLRPHHSRPANIASAMSEVTKKTASPIFIIQDCECCQEVTKRRPKTPREAIMPSPTSVRDRPDRCDVRNRDEWFMTTYRGPAVDELTFICIYLHTCKNRLNKLYSVAR